MCGRHHRRMRGWRAPSREDLLEALEDRQKDLEQEIADIHDLLKRLREEVTPSSGSEPVSI
jgi:phage shock protein A